MMRILLTALALTLALPMAACSPDASEAQSAATIPVVGRSRKATASDRAVAAIAWRVVGSKVAAGSSGTRHSASGRRHAEMMASRSGEGSRSGGANDEKGWATDMVLGLQ